MLKFLSSLQILKLCNSRVCRCQLGLEFGDSVFKFSKSRCLWSSLGNFHWTGGSGLVCHASLGCGGYTLDVLEESTRVGTVGGRDPFLSALLPFFVRNQDIDGSLIILSIDTDWVAVLNQRNWSSNLRLGRDVTDAESLRSMGLSQQPDRRNCLPFSVLNAV